MMTFEFKFRSKSHSFVHFKNGSSYSAELFSRWTGVKPTLLAGLLILQEHTVVTALIISMKH